MKMVFVRIFFTLCFCLSLSHRALPVDCSNDDLWRDYQKQKKEHDQDVNERRAMSGDEGRSNSWRTQAEDFLETTQQNGRRANEILDTRESGGDEYHKRVASTENPDGSSSQTTDLQLTEGDGDGNRSGAGTSYHSERNESSDGKSGEAHSVLTRTDSEGAQEITTSDATLVDGKWSDPVINRKFVDKNGKPIEDPDWAEEVYYCPDEGAFYENICDCLRHCKSGLRVIGPVCAPHYRGDAEHSRIIWTWRPR